MEGYDASTYGERIADIYDDWYGGNPETVVAVLAGLAGAGPALELGIGTGLIALPLAASGVKVHGIDASPAMVERLAAKAGGPNIPVTIGDMADVAVEGFFSLVYVVASTFFCLSSQEEQVRCFRNVAQHLTADGVFVLHAFVPDVTRFTRGQNTQVSRIHVDEILLDVSRHDPVAQRVVGQHVRITEAGIRLFPVQVRYAWPSELDLMARLAGLRLRHRWAGWHQEPFTAASGAHVSIYERIPATPGE
jgi:SAM-dependent methyltransferase